MSEGRRPLADAAVVVAGALGVWLGVHAVRLFLAMVVWNVAEDQPATQLGLVGLAVWAVGLVAWLPARLAGGARPAWRLGLLLAVVVVARQAVADEALTAALAFAAVVAWLWWLAAFLDEVARRGAASLLVPAALLGLAAQVAGQLALHGVDLQVLIGPGGALAALGTALAFLLALALAGDVPADARPAGAVWSALALGPYLFLQLTLLANLGRLESLAGLDLPAAGALALASLLVAVLALRWAPARGARVGVAVATVLLIALGRTGGLATLALVPAQAGLAILLAACVAPPASRRTYLASAGGALLLFVLLFVLYADYSDALGVVAWPLAALLVALPALRATSGASHGEPRLALAALGVAAAGLVLALVPLAPSRAASPAPAELKVFDYNIHQGFDLFGVPALPAIAAVIEAADADVVALQEVNRVWDVSAGVDSFAYLQWRFPRYHAVFGPMHGVHFGNAILSRSPLKEWGHERYPLGKSGLPRAFVWATLATEAGDVLVVTTHLTPYNRGEERAERAAQAQRLLDFWVSRGRPRAILAGDFNDAPDSAAVRRLVDAGLVDVLAQQGLAGTPTFHFSGSPFAAPSAQKLDYVFTTPDVRALAARVVDTTASDHRPLEARLRLR